MRTPKLEFDYLQMYFGEPYVIDLENTRGQITVLQPKIGDIIRLGEDCFYSTLNIFITNTTSYRLPLWEMGRDWNELSDFDLFLMLYKTINPEVSTLIFGDIDFLDFEYLPKYNDVGEVETVLYNSKLDIELTKDVYNHISQYLRNTFNIFPEEKFTKDPVLKKWYINKDKRQKAINEEKKAKGTEKNHSIQSIISACINHPGFKYKLQELRNVGICEFYDSVQRLQIYENSTALMKGIYSGFVDTKKLNREDMNFMKEFKR